MTCHKRVRIDNLFLNVKINPDIHLFKDVCMCVCVPSTDGQTQSSDTVVGRLNAAQRSRTHTHTHTRQLFEGKNSDFQPFDKS